MSPPRFLYFDLGKVLIDFSVERLLRQVGAAAGIGAERAHDVLFADGLMTRFECGRTDSRGLYDALCREAGTRLDYDSLLKAATDIFELNSAVLPLVAQLGQTGRPMGILSNTCEIHWEHCFSHYRIVREEFSVYALSYQIGAVKPDAAIFRAAAELAGHRPENIFFVDDRPEHVAGARGAGFDAVQFTTTAALAGELRKRGVRFNF